MSGLVQAHGGLFPELCWGWFPVYGLHIKKRLVDKMQEFTIQVKRMLKQLGLWGFLLLATVYFAGYAALLSGLLLGTGASMVYFLLMCYRVQKSASLPMAKAVFYMRTGWIMRLTFVLATLIMAVHLPGISLLGVVIGLFSLQIVILLSAIGTILRGNGQ